MKNILFVLLLLTARLFAAQIIDTNYFGSWYETYSGYYDRNCDPVTSDEAINLDDTSIVMSRRFSYDWIASSHYKYSVLSPNRVLLIRSEEDTVIITFSRNKLVLKGAGQKHVYERLPKGYNIYSKPDDLDARKLLLKNYKTKFQKDTSLSFSIFLSNCLAEIFNQPVSIDSIVKQQNYGAFIGIPDANLFKVIVSYYPKTVLSPKCALFFSERKGKIYLLNQNEVFFKPSGVDSFALDNKINFADSNVMQIAKLFSSYIVDSLPSYVYPAPPMVDTSSMVYKFG